MLAEAGLGGSDQGGDAFPGCPLAALGFVEGVFGVEPFRDGVGLDLGDQPWLAANAAEDLDACGLRGLGQGVAVDDVPLPPARDVLLEVVDHPLHAVGALDPVNGQAAVEAAAEPGDVGVRRLRARHLLDDLCQNQVGDLVRAGVAPPVVDAGVFALAGRGAEAGLAFLGVGVCEHDPVLVPVGLPRLHELDPEASAGELADRGLEELADGREVVRSLGREAWRRLGQQEALLLEHELGFALPGVEAQDHAGVACADAGAACLKLCGVEGHLGACVERRSRAAFADLAEDGRGGVVHAEAAKLRELRGVGSGCDEGFAAGDCLAEQVGVLDVDLGVQAGGCRFDGLHEGVDFAAVGGVHPLAAPFSPFAGLGFFFSKRESGGMGSSSSSTSLPWRQSSIVWSIWSANHRVAILHLSIACSTS